MGLGIKFAWGFLIVTAIIQIAEVVSPFWHRYKDKKNHK
jgi:hypothetical protein